MKKIFVIIISLFLIPSIHTIEEKNRWIEDYIETVSNFPKPGIAFKCYPKLLKDQAAFKKAIQIFVDEYKELNIDVICGLDSRGFIFGTALAYEMGVPFVMIRKSGKLPKKTEKIDYSLEYGSAQFEIEVDSLNPKDRVLIVDDLLATGGTALAAANLIRRLDAEVVGMACLIELKALNGQSRLNFPVFSIIHDE